MKKYLIVILVGFSLSGCIVGDTLALPFRATGVILNVATPDIVGDSVSGVGDAIDLAIPF